MLLTINPGSTSSKYTLFTENKAQNIKGHFKKKKDTYTFNDSLITETDFNQSFSYFINFLTKEKYLSSTKDITKIGIRIVHGGNAFTQPTLLNEENIKILQKVSELAPLHNPPALHIVHQIQSTTKDIAIYGIFDTAFHTSIPEYAKRYPLPQELSDKYAIERYGFHGTACQSVVSQVEKSLGQIPNRMIICHLGGGASITAVKNGKSIDTSMGFTPLEGVMMISRAGDLDVGILPYLEKKLKCSNEKIMDLMNKKSGIRGITGTDDMKVVVEKAQAGDTICKLAVEMFVYRIVKYIFAYYGALQGLDVLTFSGGIGVGSETLRKIICEELRMIGVRVEEGKNLNITKTPQEITGKNAEKKVFVVQVNEAEEMRRLIS